MPKVPQNMPTVQQNMPQVLWNLKVQPKNFLILN